MHRDADHTWINGCLQMLLLLEFLHAYYVVSTASHGQTAFGYDMILYLLSRDFLTLLSLVEILA